MVMTDPMSMADYDNDIGHVKEAARYTSGIGRKDQRGHKIWRLRLDAFVKCSDLTVLMACSVPQAYPFPRHGHAVGLHICT